MEKMYFKSDRFKELYDIFKSNRNALFYARSKGEFYYTRSFLESLLEWGCGYSREIADQENHEWREAMKLVFREIFESMVGLCDQEEIINVFDCMLRFRFVDPNYLKMMSSILQQDVETKKIIFEKFHDWVLSGRQQEPQKPQGSHGG